MLTFLRKTIFNKYLWLVLLPLGLGWILLADRLQTRTDRVIGTQLASVKQIWGGNLAQPMPSVRYKRSGAEVSTLSRGEVQSSQISVILKMDYRKKGLVYYTGYNAEFIGKYTLQNSEKDKIYLSFIFPYPTKQAEGMLQDVKLLVNGEEDVANTEYQPNLALWTGVLEAAQTMEITMRYKGRGLDQFIYGFEAGRQINNFALQIELFGAKELDYAQSTMPPTTPPQETATGKILVWKLDRALTQLNMGVILPDRLNVEKQLVVMTYRAPVFFFLFLVSLATILVLAREPVNFIPLAIMSVTYFLFYPFFVYLLVYIDLIPSLATSFGVIALLLLNYARLLYGFKVALAVVLAYTFYLGITSIAALLPTYTGLILTLEGVVLMGIIMQVLSRYKDLKIETLIESALTAKTTTLKPKPIGGNDHATA